MFRFLIQDRCIGATSQDSININQLVPVSKTNSFSSTKTVPLIDIVSESKPKIGFISNVL